MAKRMQSAYVPGIRSREWLKIKNSLTREGIICGYTEGRGSRKHFGALVLGEFKKGRLHYIGHTGTGFSSTKLKELWTLMQDYKLTQLPLDINIPLNGEVTGKPN